MWRRFPLSSNESQERFFVCSCHVVIQTINLKVLYIHLLGRYIPVVFFSHFSPSLPIPVPDVTRVPPATISIRGIKRLSVAR